MTTTKQGHVLHIESIYEPNQDQHLIRITIGPSAIVMDAQDAQSIALGILEAAATVQLDTAIVKFMRSNTNLNTVQIFTLLQQVHLAQDEAKKEVPKTQ